MVTERPASARKPSGTRQTRGKLLRALDNLERFRDADVKAESVPERNQERLRRLIDELQDIESDMYWAEND